MRALRPVMVVLFFLVVPYLLRPVSQILLIFFCGILLAVFLDGATELLCRAIPVPRHVGLLLAIFVLLTVNVIFLVFAGGRIAEQMAELLERLPAAIEDLRQRIGEVAWLRDLLSAPADGAPARTILETAGTFFAATFAVVAYTVIAIALGIYIAFSPRVYTGTILALIPGRWRPRGEEVLEKLWIVLRWWLVGRLASMTVIAILTTIGLLLIGEPLALVLGVIAGLLSFIPFLGPMLSVVPAILVTLTRGLDVVLLVILVYSVVQALESNLITPLIERQAVMVPPAYVIGAQFLFGVLLGFLGILLATPLVVVITVLVQMLYVEQVLGERVKILGDHT
jgi:predicted PurR-regulated permease PerM